jgi:single-strand DNA-binding protein
MNACYFLGNLGRDPVVKCTQTGKTYARFSIGCSEKWGDKEITNWVNVVCWDNVAQAVGNYLAKGKLIMVKGRWTSRKYTDQKTGEVKYITELNAQVVSLPIGMGKQSAGEPPANQQPCGAAGFSQFGSPATQQPSGFPDDPPF